MLLDHPPVVAVVLTCATIDQAAAVIASALLVEEPESNSVTCAGTRAAAAMTGILTALSALGAIVFVVMMVMMMVEAQGLRK